MASNATLFLIFVTLTSVTAQTFQYSRGWTNGKRAHTPPKYAKDILDSSLTPCQLEKLKYILEGKPLNERIFAPCDYTEDEDNQNQPRRFKNEHNGDLFDAFQ